MTEDTERDRGILSPDDREYLRGEKDLGEGSEYNAKRRIRNRVENAILDFTLLFDQWEDDEQEKVFWLEDGSVWRGWEDPEFRAGQRDVLALIFHHGLIKRIMSKSDTPAGLPMFELLEEAYERAGIKEGFVVESVEEPKIEATRLRNILRDLEEDDRQLPPRALGLALESEKINDETLDRIQDLIREDLIGDE